MSPTHIGMSIVATDVGGGFSIGLGGLGYAMGLSGSWLLFTGFVGAWLAAILVVPRLKNWIKSTTCLPTLIFYAITMEKKLLWWRL